MIQPAYAARWQELAKDGTISTLYPRWFVDRKRANESYDRIKSGGSARHPPVTVVSYCYEWVAPMLKAAALVTVELFIGLAEKGLTLQDGHPWNILFDNTKPVYIDAGWIVQTRDDNLWGAITAVL